MRAQNDGFGLSNFSYQATHFYDLIGVKSCGWFIQDNDRGIVNQGLGESYTLSVSFREFSQSAGAIGLGFDIGY